MTTLHLPRVSEDLEQCHLFDWLRLTRWRGRALADYAWHTPNGGSRNVREAVKLKRLGVKPGVPDVTLAIPAVGFHGLYLELKAHGGRVSPEQRAVHELLREQGYRVEVPFGWVEAAKAIERYLGVAGTLQEWG
jgi:hypothetical protein